MKAYFPLLTFSLLLLLSGTQLAQAQVINVSQLTIKEIMSKDYVGKAPQSVQWSQDSKQLFFNWKTSDAVKDSSYRITPDKLLPERIEASVSRNDRPERGTFSSDRKLQLLSDQNGLSLVDHNKKDTTRFFFTKDRVGGLSFSFDETKALFSIDQDLYWWDFASGEFRQLTNFQKGNEETQERQKPSKESRNEQDEWLFQDQKNLFPKVSKQSGRFSRPYSFGNRMQGGRSVGGPSAIYFEGFSAYGASLSPDNRFVTYSLNKRGPETKGTEMPVYVTASGYTEIQNTRSKVGRLPGEMAIGVYNLLKDSIYKLSLETLPGIFDAPEYYKDYPDRSMKLEEAKSVSLSGPYWSGDGKYGVMTARSSDNKDRWILLVDLESGSLKNLDHQHDEAWIGGPGIGYGGSVGWMPDNQSIWFQSEETGYSHLYTLDVSTGKKKALTSGNFEVSQPFMSKNKKYWYFHSNEVHPGEKHFYRLPIKGGDRTQITSMTGSNRVSLSPDEKHLAITFSFANRPPELYYQANKAGALCTQITESRSAEFKAYDWRVPEFVTFEAEDGTTVYARLYEPATTTKNKAAVIFVHGAGYLQNAHKWWSTYYHEYMFHNILADNGYTVLDIDYRGSAGYGRDCRTGIYRWMGGKDLSDNVDGANFLVDNYGIDSGKIGLYGGSYGGFIALMAMFNAPEVFAAGAGLRSVTDWAHYNHGYTANILNTPVLDSIAYAQSSPIYFAEGLQGDLLMCHGMLDDNVHYQDIIRMVQRLIDLGKDNWELASYPLQRHSFTDPDAWTDEYKRIFKLFQNTIGKN
ncbi:MAG: S9 family peptidase [Bacteroidetes bacterium]|nr:S9 family peptidase [Bacteroidota bacterium]MBT7465477.1 S9 family peptidase [Bacteroidota bacterium]